MRKVWSQLGVESPWNYEVLALAEQGMDHHKAKVHVIMQWMMDGDLRPLLASIKENGVLRGPVLGLLAKMLENGELAFKSRGRGRRRDPEAAARDQLVANMYEDFPRAEAEANFDDLTEAIGKVTASSVETVKQAVTTGRKAKAKPKPI
jgi:hypothetical protein